MTFASSAAVSDSLFVGLASTGIKTLSDKGYLVLKWLSASFKPLITLFSSVGLINNVSFGCFNDIKGVSCFMIINRHRLSENMAVQLTDGNPDITDLSDENRPGKLNERLSELYDNQYTAAQEILEANYGRSYSGDKLTEKMAQLLLNILKVSLQLVPFFLVC